MELFLLACIVLLIIFVSFLLILKREDFFENDEEAGRRAGREGERIASSVLRRNLRDSDIILNNVFISYDGKSTELDNVIINSFGVFIVEVKNYVGVLHGNENDYEWTKYKITDAGNVYEKQVKNPIKQVKRQIYILANYLNYYGVDVWVKGYVYLVNKNSPVNSQMIISDADIYTAIHTPDRKRLSKKTVTKIEELLEKQPI